MFGELLTTLEVAGKQQRIRTDFRDIIDILMVFDNPDLSDEKKIWICLTKFYIDFNTIPQKAYNEAYTKALEFFDYGIKTDNKTSPRLVDWKQDEALIMAAVNKSAGCEVSSIRNENNERYLHWWTFLGYYMEIGECVFSQVISIRSKLAKNKPLDKIERDFYNSNKSMCKLPRHISTEQKKKLDALNALLN